MIAQVPLSPIVITEDSYMLNDYLFVCTLICVLDRVLSVHGSIVLSMVRTICLLVLERIILVYHLSFNTSVCLYFVFSLQLISIY